MPWLANRLLFLFSRTLRIVLLAPLGKVMGLRTHKLQGGHVLVLLVTVTVGMTMLETTRVPILEDVVCRVIYDDDGGDHHDRSDGPRNCKINPVQVRLAMLNGWVENATAVQGLLFTLPYIWLADIVGKPRLLLVGFVASTISVVYFFAICLLAGKGLPLYLVTLFPFFELVGGGTKIAYILLYSILALKNHVGSRTLVFYITGAMLLLARAGTMVLVGFLLEAYPHSVGPATILAYSLNVPIALWCVPSSSSGYRGVSADPDDDSSVTASSEEYPEVAGAAEPGGGGGGGFTRADEGDPHTMPPTAEQSPERELGVFRRYKRVLLTAYEEYLGRAVFRTSLLICAIKIVAQDVQIIQPQWSVKRFDWSFSATSYISAYASFVCMVTLACLPFLSAFLTDRLGGSAQRTDIVIFRLSLGFRIVGTAAMALASAKMTFLTAVGIQALSAGAYDTFKSFLTGLSSATHVAELYALISLVETLAHMVSSQMWANILVVSLGLDGLGMSLPFWVSSALTLLTLVMFQVMIMQAKDSSGPQHSE